VTPTCLGRFWCIETDVPRQLGFAGWEHAGQILASAFEYTDAQSAIRLLVTPTRKLQRRQRSTIATTHNDNVEVELRRGLGSGMPFAQALQQRFEPT
jgi:hypothetical protein